MSGGFPSVPYGTIVIRETKAPYGYEASDETWIVTFTEGSDGKVVRTFYNGNGEKLDATSKIDVGNETTPGTAAISEPVATPEISTTALDKSTELHEGFWKDGKIAVVDTVRISKIVPGQTYIIRGTLMDKDTGKALLDENGEKITKECTFTADAEATAQTLSFAIDKDIAKEKEIVVFEKLYWVNETDDGRTEVLRATHEDLEDADQTVVYPEIRTTATDGVTGTHEGNASAETVTVVDTVKYNKLIAGNTYTIKGTLYDKETGEILTDEDGNAVTSEKTFTAQAASGSVDIEFTVSGSVLKGKSVVAFEDAYSKDKLIATHCDIEDEDQTVTYPEIHTSACDDITGEDEGYAGKTVSITDTVSYKKLTVGNTYKLDGTLMDKATNEAITDEDGNAIEGSTTFTATDSEGTIEVHFTCEGSLVEGKDVVVFENMTNVKDEVTVAEHKDIEDENQLVTYPKLRTTATDGITEGHEGLAEGTVTINDAVKYSKLKVGETYKVTGTLMDKATNKAILDENGNTITATKEFVPETRDGEVIITFEVPAKLVEGKHVVAFEDCTREGKEIAIHADIEDEDQTVTYPKVGTTATDIDTETHYVAMKDSITLKDVVAYEGLVPGNTYVLETVLMNRNTEDVIPVSVVKGESTDADADADVDTDTDTEEGSADTDIKIDDGPDTEAATETAEVITTTFVPAEENGTVEVTFAVDKTELSGTAAVVFEKVYNVNEDGEKKDLIGKHEDLEDEDQTVYIPEIHTTALDATTNQHEGLADGTVKINDRVYYKSLKVGEEYTVTGTLMNKATGEAILDKDGNAITASTTFTAKATDGDVLVTFEVPSELVAGKKVVAFETVSYEDLEIAIHADIEDKDQTVSYPKISTTASDTKTNSKMSLIEKEMSITDTVKFENLIVGQKYRLVGTLMDKNTGNALTVNGQPVQAAGYFETDEANGTAAITFTFDGSAYEGGKLVAFEKIYAVYEDENGNETLEEVAHHEDIDDVDQTIYVPKVGTKATINGDKSAVASGTVTVKDTVSYEGLIVGETYKVSGTLMDKSTGKALVVSGKTVTGEATFKATSESGTVDVTFTFDATGLGGKSLVVFEKLYVIDGGVEKEIGHHEDINDEAQTVTLTTPPTTPPGPKTGDDTQVGTMVILMIVSLGAGVMVIMMRKKRRVD